MVQGKQWVDQIAITVDGTPLRHEIMDDLVEVIVDSSLHLPGMFIINIHDDEFEWLDSDTFKVGKVVKIEMPRDDTTDATFRIISGEITAIEPSFGENQTTTFTVRGYDKSHRLSRGTQARTFINVSDSDIVKKIAGEAGLSPQAEATSEVYDHVYQNNLTDLQFLHDRAQRIGFEVYVDESKLYFQKPKGSRDNVELEWGVDLRSFRPRLSIWRQVQKVFVKGWNPNEKKEIIGQATSTQSSPQINVGGNGAAVSGSAFGNAETVVVRRPVNTQREADLLAQALLDDINAGFVEADGVAIGNPKLLAGIKVKITKIGQRFSGEYVVTAARHVYTPSGYETHLTVQGARPRQMADLMHDQSVFEDEGRAWGGVVPAIVTNINDPDKKGRVKLKYPWMDDQLESFWVRVSAIGAGNNRGFLWLPEVNDEVLVAFEHGDFNRPYVIGSLWNGKDSPPDAFDQAAKNNKSEIRTIKSREGHIITLVDGPSDKYIEIVDCKQGTSIKLDANAQTLTIDSKKDISINSNTSLKISTTSNVEISASANVKITGNGNIDIQAAGQLNLKGAMVNIN
jgi:phage protein D/phage baseplate assembly protein gpV